MRLVLDTNSLIDAAGDDYSAANRILDLVLSGKAEVFANKPTLRENKLLVQQKVKDEAFLKKLNEYFTVVRPVFADNKLDVVSDPEDNKILSSAVTARADYLITSDRALLDLHPFGDVAILTPQDFWSRYQEESGSGWQDWLKSFANFS